MATANTKFKAENGLLVVNTADFLNDVNVTGNTTVGVLESTSTATFANVDIQGTLTANVTSFVGNVAFDTSTLYIDALNNRAYVNATSATVAFYVEGAANVSGEFTAANVVATNANLTNITASGITVGSTNSSFDTSVLFIDAVNNRVGVNNSTPDVALKVTGAANVTGNAAVGGTMAVTGAATFGSTLGVTGAATLGSVSTGGVTSSANVTLTGGAVVVGGVTGTSGGATVYVNPGSYMTGGGILTSNVTITADATTSATASKLVARDSNANINANTVGATTVSATTFNGSLNGTAAQSNTLYDGSAYRSGSQAVTALTVAVRDTNASISANLFSGTATSARYADLAEKYVADVEYPAGTLICVGGEKEVTAAVTWASPVIGVVSTSPAYMMNSELVDGTYIALKGRVPVRAQGSVRKGDVLVASDNPGVAVAGSKTDNYFAVSLDNKDGIGEGIVEAVIL